MPNKKISELAAAGALTGAEQVELVQGGVNVRGTTQDIANLGVAGSAVWGAITGTIASQTDLVSFVNTKSDELITYRSVSGNHTLDSTDLAAIAAGQSYVIVGNDTGDLTIPPNASVAFSAGTVFLIRGFANVIAGVGVTATGDSGDLVINLTASLEKTATNTWLIHNGATAGGGGTVTTFSSGNLSPLFTTSVSNATTTPALSFTAVNQNANIVYAGPASGAAAAPTFRALVALDIPDISATYYLASNPSGYTSNTGTVTAVSVASANGFAGSSSGGATPALTISTTVTGVLKGNGTAISAATDADITGKVLTGFSSGAGTVSAADTILQAINKLDGNDGTKWSLASGGALTGANTITGTEANTLTVTGTWTATANNSFQTNFAGSLTARGTASDNLVGTKFTTTLVAGAVTQVLSVIQISPTFTPGAHSPNRRAIDIRAGWITIGLTTHQANNKGQLDIIDDGVADQFITLRNSSGTPLVRVNTSGLQMGASNMAIQAQTNSSANMSTGRGWLFSGDLSASSNVANLFTSTSGGGITDGTTAKVLIRSASTYTVSTGTGSYIQNLIEPTYNITGGTQTVGGIYYNPTETSLTGTTHYSFRSSSTTALGGVGMAAPTALWHLGAVTTARASLRIEAGSTTTAPSSPNSGDIWHEGTGNRLMFRQGAASNEVICASAVTTEAVASDTTVTIKLNNVTYKLLARA